jgi:hypothetical protein
LTHRALASRAQLLKSRAILPQDKDIDTSRMELSAEAPPPPLPSKSSSSLLMPSMMAAITGSSNTPMPPVSEAESEAGTEPAMATSNGDLNSLPPTKEDTKEDINSILNDDTDLDGPTMLGAFSSAAFASARALNDAVIVPLKEVEESFEQGLSCGCRVPRKSAGLAVGGVVSAAI